MTPVHIKKYWGAQEEAGSLTLRIENPSALELMLEVAEYRGPATGTSAPVSRVWLSRMP
jgi:hypothetical protein